jgi:hypothetical protein
VLKKALVPHFADWIELYLTYPDGTQELASAVHADPERTSVLQARNRRYLLTLPHSRHPRRAAHRPGGTRH